MTLRKIKNCLLVIQKKKKNNRIFHHKHLRHEIRENVSPCFYFIILFIWSMYLRRISL